MQPGAQMRAKPGPAAHDQHAQRQRGGGIGESERHPGAGEPLAQPLHQHPGERWIGDAADDQHPGRQGMPPAAAHDGRQRIGRPDRDRPDAEQPERIRRRGGGDLPPRDRTQHDRRNARQQEAEDQRRRPGDDQGMHHQRGCLLSIARTERTGDGGNHAAAHRARRHLLHHQREWQHHCPGAERRGALTRREPGLRQLPAGLQQHDQRGRRRQRQNTAQQFANRRMRGDRQGDRVVQGTAQTTERSVRFIGGASQLACSVTVRFGCGPVRAIITCMMQARLSPAGNACGRLEILDRQDPPPI